MAIYQSKQFPYPYYGLSSGRIEVDITLPVMPLQRHIWTRQDGTERAEEWIRTIRMTPESLLKTGYTKID